MTKHDDPWVGDLGVDRGRQGIEGVHSTGREQRCNEVDGRAIPLDQPRDAHRGTTRIPFCRPKAPLLTNRSPRVSGPRTATRPPWRTPGTTTRWCTIEPRPSTNTTLLLPASTTAESGTSSAWGSTPIRILAVATARASSWPTGLGTRTTMSAVFVRESTPGATAQIFAG